MTDSITPEQWAKIANEVEPQPKGSEWALDNSGYVVRQSGNAYYPCGYKGLSPNLRQQLRLADYLAEKGVVVYVDGQPTAYRMGPDGIPEHTIREDGSILFHTLARHKNINLCRALAVLALIEERE